MASPGPKSDKFWSDAVRLAAFRKCEDDPERRKYINIIAANLVEAAVGGDMAAVKEIGDRIDGRAPQSVALTGEDGGPIQVEDVKATAKLAAFLSDRKKPG